VLGLPHLSSPWSDFHSSWRAPLHALLRGTDDGECMKMAVGHQEFSTSFTRDVNQAAKGELEEDLH
jgi:hypothetical protein